jgi:hypothetical protein
VQVDLSLPKYKRLSHIYLIWSQEYEDNI